MRNPLIITIGREYGSGGRQIGELVAKTLGIAYYDKKLIPLAAQKSGLSDEFIANNEQRVRNGFMQNLAASAAYSSGFFSSQYLPLSESIFISEAQVIRDIAAKESAVIVGRCADYVLKDRPNTISVFLKAEMQSKVERAVKYYGVDPQKAEDRIRKADKQRASYYNYYATATWGDVNNYDLCVDTGKLGVEGTVELIARFVELRQAMLEAKK